MSKVIIKDEARTRSEIVRFLEKTKSEPTKSRVNSSTRWELIKDVGMDGFVLFHYYVGKQNTKKFLFTDLKAARTLGLNPRKVGIIRRKLIKMGWFMQYNVCYDSKAQEWVIRTILGRANIREHKQNSMEERSNSLDYPDRMFGPEVSGITEPEDVL